MKLNISIPQRQRKNLRLVLNELRSKEILNGYCCTKNCFDCELNSFDRDRGICISDLNRKGCKKNNLKTPVFSFKVELNEIEELQVI